MRKEVPMVQEKKDFVDAVLDNINVKLIAHPEELVAIFEVIYKLKTSGWIVIKDDWVICENFIKNSAIYF